MKALLNSEAEREVIGAVLVDNDVLPNVQSLLSASDFATTFYRRAFVEMERLAAQGTPFDPVVIAGLLATGTDAGELREHLMRAMEMSTLATVRTHALAVAVSGRLRQLVAACEEVINEAHESTIVSVEEAQRFFADAATKLGVSATFGRAKRISMKESVTETFKTINERYTNRGTLPGVASGYQRLNELLLGWQRKRFYVVAAQGGVGKAQPLDAHVLTPNGFITMGEVQIGTLVIGVDGKPHRVVGVFPQGQKQTYRVTFTDGSSTECCAEHLWFTQTKRERSGGHHGSVKSTTEIRETLRLKRGEHNHHLPTMAAAEITPVGCGLLDPWVVGLLLSDGDLTGTCVRLSNPEPDIRERVLALLPAGDEYGYDDEVTVNVRRKKRSGKKSETALALEHHGLLGTDSFTKFIPDQYLFASIQDRTDLLRGILDADGYVTCSGHSVEYVTVSERMRDGVLWLARSLGGIVSCVERLPTFTYLGEKKRGAKCWRMVLRFPGGLTPVSSVKHLAVWKGASRALGRAIESIEPTRITECQCIMLNSADHLYVTDDFVVTHNTALGINFTVNAASVGAKCFVNSLEMGHDELTLRALASESRVGGIKLETGTLDEHDFSKLGRGVTALTNLPIWYPESPARTINALRLECQSLQREQGLDIVVVDYVQLMEAAETRGKTREQAVAEVSRGLKRIAMELNVAVIAMAQLSRSNKRGEEPGLQDLRESGALEQDPNVVIALWAETDDAHEVNYKVLKNRGGPLGSGVLKFHRSIQRFEELPR